MTEQLEHVWYVSIESKRDDTYRYCSTSNFALSKSSSDVKQLVGSVMNAKCRKRPINVDWSHNGLSTSIRSGSAVSIEDLYF